MKLIIAIVQDQDEAVLTRAFGEAKLPATKLSSTGSFLRSGNTTFLIGVDDRRVDEVLATIEENCKKRDEYVISPTNYDINLDMTTSFPIEVEIGGAIVFVLPIEAYYRY